MNQKYTLHTHTVGFDGRNTVSEMIGHAREQGFNTIGISNHFIVHPQIKNTKMYPFSVKGGYGAIYSESFDEVMSKFIPHYDELNKVQSENPDMKILRGMEVDFFYDAEWRCGFEKCVAQLKPDYIIGSCHFVEHDDTLLNSHDWKNADSTKQDILLKKYWYKVADAAQSGIFTWMAHLDLPKKVGLGRDEKWIDCELFAVDAIAQSNGALEINTGIHKTGLTEVYPSNRILQMVANKNIPVLISDDAHAASQIGRNFDVAENLIQQYKLVHFQYVK